MLLKPALGLPLDPIAKRPDAGSRRPLEEEMRACWSRRSLGPLGLFRTPVWLGKSPGFIKSLVSVPAGPLAPSDS